MIIETKKKEIELGVYKQEIYDNLQEAYKTRFSKYVNVQNYDIYTNEEKTDNENNTKNKEDGKKHKNINISCSRSFSVEVKNPSGDIIIQPINILESFKTFIGKKLDLANEEFYDEFYDEDDRTPYKEITKLPFSNIQQQKNEQIISRIDVIKNTISEIKNALKSKSELIHQENNYLPTLVEKLKQIENTLYDIIKYGETEDDNFLNNLKYYKFLHNLIIHNEQCIFDIIQQMKYTSNKKQITNKTQTLNLSNLLSFQKQLFYDKFQTVTNKVDRFVPLLHNSCIEGEAVANLLLSYLFLLNVGMNEKIFKRIVNYISLAYIKLKKWEEYLRNEKYRKRENLIFNFKSSINKLYKENLKNVFHINIREYDKQMLLIYKKILNAELQIQMISNEVNKITETIQQLDHNLNIDTTKLKSIFSRLQD